MTWQPIETAPKDGTETLPCFECHGFGVIEGSEAVCCGNLSPSGGCWGGCAVEAPRQRECSCCGGSGDEIKRVDDLVKSAFRSPDDPA